MIYLMLMKIVKLIAKYWPKSLEKIIKIFCLTTLIAVASYFVYSQFALSRKIESYSHKSVTIAGEKFTLLVANSDSEKRLGLSVINKLPHNYGMLFEVDPNTGIWMKDMKYPIDIIWIDSENKISHLVASARPSSYPGTIYKNPTPSKAEDAYIIEINSGEIKRLRLKLGDELIFN